MKLLVSPRTVVFLLLSSLSSLAAGSSISQVQSKQGAQPAAQCYLPAPVRSTPVTRQSPSQDREVDAKAVNKLSVQRMVAARGATRYEVNPDSFLSGLAALSVARSQAERR